MKKETRMNVDALQAIVDCPRWLQKRMRANLRKASKDRVSATRAKIAQVLLKNCDAQQKVADPKIATSAEKARPTTRITERAQTADPPKRDGIRRIANAVMGKCKNAICNFQKNRRVLLPSHDRV